MFLRFLLNTALTLLGVYVIVKVGIAIVAASVLIAIHYGIM